MGKQSIMQWYKTNNNLVMFRCWFSVLLRLTSTISSIPIFIIIGLRKSKKKEYYTISFLKWCQIFILKVNIFEQMNAIIFVNAPVTIIPQSFFIKSRLAELRTWVKPSFGYAADNSSWRSLSNSSIWRIFSKDSYILRTMSILSSGVKEFVLLQ